MGAMRYALCFGSMALAVATSAAQLEHRLWLVGGPPPTAQQLAQLQRAGVDAWVLPVAEAAVADTSATVKAVPLGDAELLRGQRLWGLVWLEGEAKEQAAASLWSQVGPLVRGIPGEVRGLVLATRSWVSGVWELAAAVAKASQLPVEVAAPVEQLVAQLPEKRPPEVAVVALALGNLRLLGVPEPSPQDAAAALETLDARGIRWRGGIGVGSQLLPPAPPGENPWAWLMRGELDYQPGPEGDTFLPRGGGQKILASLADGARLHRDLGLLLRPVRHRLLGWDSLGIPPASPAVGLSLEGFAAYFQGATPEPKVAVRLAWVSPTVVKVVVENQAPFASAFATTGNAVELVFSGTEVKDVQLAGNGAVGADFGRREGGFVRTPRGAATAVRLFLRAFPPQLPVEAGEVQFVSRPKGLAAFFTARLGDGREVSGPAAMLEGTP